MKQKDHRSARLATGLTSSHDTGSNMFRATRALHKKISDVADSHLQHDTATYVSGATTAVENRAGGIDRAMTGNKGHKAEHKARGKHIHLCI